jgi:hypothetical protein
VLVLLVLLLCVGVRGKGVSAWQTSKSMMGLKLL